jgi:RimJ/RimL family protein N-acetyltransferase
MDGNIDTQRLSLRPLSEGDLDLYCDIYADPDTMRFVGPPMSRERAERSFQKVLAFAECRPVERLFLAIVEKASQRAVGIGSLQDLDVPRRRIEAGVMLATGSRVRGFGKECLSALVTHAFAVLPVDEVWIQHAAENAIAQGVPVSLGLSRNTAAPTHHDGPQMYVWSAYRDSWRPVSNA